MSVRLSKAIDVADAARAILARVQTFEDGLFEKGEDRSPREHVGIEPMLLALSMELALKAWFMFDFDTADIKKTHHLGKLFDALKPESQTRLDAEFKNSVAPGHYPSFFYSDIGIKDVLEQHANAFVDWRYLHEAIQLHFDQGAFVATLEMILREFRARYRTVPVAPHWGSQ